MPSIHDLSVGMELPQRVHTPTNVSLFLYNAAVWNAHRIHYDEPYTTEVEGHAGVVIDGPLQGDWISQVALNWLGPDDALVRFEYSNRRASHLGDTLVSGGRVTSIDLDSGQVGLELYVADDAGEVLTPGTATIRLAS